MKRLLVVVAILLGVCVAYAAAHLALIEIGREVVVLDKWTSEGSTRRTRLWIVDDGGYAWFHHGYADSGWILRLEDDPMVTVERVGVTSRYRATAVPEAGGRMHELFRAKYGFADRWVRFVSGGLEGCRAVPVRLELTER